MNQESFNFTSTDKEWGSKVESKLGECFDKLEGKLQETKIAADAQSGDPLFTKEIMSLLGQNKEFIPGGTTGKGIIVGVIDTGIDAEHESFKGRVERKVWYRYDGDGSVNDNMFQREGFGHGTHVAGTILGVAKDARIYDYRVFGNKGKYDVTESILRAVVQAVNDGCHIINMRLGSVSLNPEHNPFGYKIYKYAMLKGVHLVVASGNDADGNPLTDEASYPASYPGVISVAAAKMLGDGSVQIAGFSRSHPSIDVCAPGVDIFSTLPGNRYGRLSGTSMAAPHVAGLSALILERYNNRWEHCNLPEILAYVAKDVKSDGLNNDGHDFSTGHGYLTFKPKL